METYSPKLLTAVLRSRPSRWLNVFPFIIHSSSFRLHLKCFICSSERHFLTTLPPPLLFSTWHFSSSSEHLTQGIIICVYVWWLPLPDSKRHLEAVINTSVLWVPGQYLAHYRHSMSTYWVNEWFISTNVEVLWCFFVVVEDQLLASLCHIQ